jgi:hypothetical protein
MTETIERFLKGLYQFATDQIIKKEEVEQYLGLWGFTIDRTFYGSESEDQWQKLLQKATVSAKGCLEKLEGVNCQPYISRWAWSVLRSRLGLTYDSRRWVAEKLVLLTRYGLSASRVLVASSCCSQ